MTVQPSSHSEDHTYPSFLAEEGALQRLAAFWQKIAEHALTLLTLDGCALMAVNAPGTDLLLLAGAPQPALSIQTEPVVLSLQTGPLAKLAEQYAPLVLANTRLDAQFRLLQAPGTLNCLPLFAENQLLGLLLASTSSFTPLEPAGLDLLSMLAEQAALAIGNARQAELVRDANRMKANFLSLITHELRSPLNVINGYLDLALAGMAGRLNQEQQEFIQRARASSEHLYALIEDLLLAARADASQLRLNKERVSLSELINNTFEELELTASDARVSLEEVLPATLPDIFGDHVRLQQVLRNLIINALQATPTGGSVTVAARVLPTEQASGLNKIEVSVRDTGRGIAPAYQQRIFERFFQVPLPGGGRASGQGLGLAIVKMIVELHGGHIRVESSPDQGSTLFFTLASAQ